MSTAIATRAALCVAAGLAADAAGQVRLARERFGGTTAYASPIALVQPPGETRRHYVIGQSGLAWVIRDGVRLPAPFMDLTGIVVAGGESGVLGVAFHPDFQDNGFLYVCYSGGEGGAPTGTYITRLATNPANPEVVTPGSASPVFFTPRGTGIHNGGWIGFGPDGFLYISTGEAGNPAHAQNPASLHGKMLRIDVDGDDFPDPARNYAIPPGNPFSGSATAAREVWSMGLRNPWRCSFDRILGNLWIGDVGAGAAGEIDFQPAAPPPNPVRNYGWPCMEGNVCLGGTACTCNSPALTPPVHDVGRPAGTAATTGGYVYRGSAIPGLAGTYIFADFGGASWSFRRQGSVVSEFTVRTGELGTGSWSSLGEDSAGELYLCSLSGVIYKIVAACGANCDGSARQPVLNINDFLRFISRFAAGHSYANCDGSTTPPVLNALDFQCFMNLYITGCP